MYRILPSGNREMLYELIPESTLLFVTDDGIVVTAQPVQCDKKAKLVTIRSREGSIVRTLDVRDVFTRHDQLWLCWGRDAVRWSLGSTLQAQVRVTDTGWDAPESRFATVEIDLHKGHPAPERDFCPDVVRIEAEPGAILPLAIHRETPEYPVVALKARISGIVRAQLVIGRDGTVTSVTITKPLPFGLDESVRTALRQWTFVPQPEPLSGEIAFRFEILRTPILEVTTISCFRSPVPMPTPARAHPAAAASSPHP
jgi:TonB family protein